MILHNLKIAWRNLMKYKLHTLISMMSLTVGMVCFALSALWIRYENSFDAWWPDAENVYMLQGSGDASVIHENGEYHDFLPFPAGQRQRERIPQIDKLARMQVSGCVVLPTPECRDSMFCGTFGIDSGVQEMMDIRVLDGRKKLVLKADEAALPLSMARRLFGRTGAVGQRLYCMMDGNNRCLTVVAVIEDIRRPTSFAYDFLKGPDEGCVNSDNIWSTSTFIRVKPENVDKVAKALEKEVLTIPGGERYVAEKTGNYRDWQREFGYRMLPLKEVRRSNVMPGRVVQYNHLRLFVILGVIVICCALFNYFTMLITRIRIRRRELALRYVHGASPWSLLTLLSTEMLLLLSASILAAVGIVSLTIEDFKEICRIDEPHSFFVGWFLVYALAAAVVSLAVTAVIVLFSNRHQLHQAAGRHSQPGSLSAHSVLLTLQLAVSVGAVFCSFVMMNQIHYLFSSPDMGFARHNRGQLWYARRYDGGELPAVEASRVEQLLRQMPEIEDFLVDYPYPIPSGFNWTKEVKTEDIDRAMLLTAQADEHYFRFMELQMVEGEFINSHDDSKMVCINETAARALGRAGRVGGEFSSLYNDGHYVVKGIVRDLSYMPPTTPVQPLMFIQRRGNPTGNVSFHFPFHVKEGTDHRQFARKLEDAVERVCSENYGISVYFAEEAYDAYLRSERILCRLLMLVTVVCVLIALFGILSMVSLACERRRREIAVRKVHGAKTAVIIRLFLRDYMRMLLFSGVLAFPVGYYLMHLWVRQYVKQAPVPLWVYPAILLAMAVLILLTVFWQIRRAARQNPADVIKSD